MNHRLDRAVTFIIVAMIVATLLFIVVLVVGQWPQWWQWVIFERTPMTWLESVLLFATAIIAGACLVLAYIQKKPWYGWLLLVSGFFYLTLDERFALHERIRDKLLAPNDIKIPIFFWTHAGDFILLCFMVVGLLLLPRILRLFKPHNAAYRTFIVAVIVAAIAVVLDSIPVDTLSIHWQRVLQFVEEMLETTAMLAFLAAHLLICSHSLNGALNRTQQET